MRTIHLAYTVPRGNIFERGINKISANVGLPPLYRNANNFLIPWKKPIRAPHSITYHLLQSLRPYGNMKMYSLHEQTIAKLGRDDLFIAQPVQDIHDPLRSHPEYNSICWQTLQKYPDSNYTLIVPYCSDPQYISWLREILIRHNKRLILICGKIWTDEWQNSPLKDIPIEKMIRVNMSIDLNDYPVVKKNFNPVGHRKYLYIGHTSWYKNTKQLEEIAKNIPGFEGAHIGGGTVIGWKKLADFADLTTEYMQNIANEYDIFVNTSSGDPQATTILENMCFGFAVACTPESGYEYPSISKLSTNDTNFNIKELLKLQHAPESELLERARQNREIAATHHSWNTFCKEVISFLDLS